MKIENLFTDDTTIKITVLKINNKNLTKSIFNQLHLNSPFSKLYDLKENVVFLGYVNDKTRWIIWTDNDFLYKYDMKYFYPLLKLDIDNSRIEHLLNTYPSETVKSLYDTSEAYSFAKELDEKEKEVINNKKQSVDEIMREVIKRQIFL